MGDIVMHARGDRARTTMMRDASFRADGVGRPRGRDARAANVMAARAVADAVRSTLGPKGLDKMLVDGAGEVSVTNDGATILRGMDVSDPAARMVVEAAATLERELGDGTTTAVVLAGELLRHAETLADDLHATALAEGFRDAAAVATRALEGLAREAPGGREEALRRVAATAMASKAAAPEATRLADLAVRAVLAVADGRRADLSHVRLAKLAGRALAATDLVEGVVLDKARASEAMPRFVAEARVALVEGALTAAKPARAATLRLADPRAHEAFVAEEETRVARAVSSLASSGATAIFVEKRVDDRAIDLLARSGILLVAGVGGETLSALARATGARPVANPREVGEADLGRASLVEEAREGGAPEVLVTGGGGARSVTLRVRGASEESVEEVARTLEDALGVARPPLQPLPPRGRSGRPRAPCATRPAGSTRVARSSTRRSPPRSRRSPARSRRMRGGIRSRP